MNQKLLIFGLFLIAIGMLLWLNSMEVLHLSGDQIAGSIFPLALIGLGVWLMTRKRRRKPLESDSTYSSAATYTMPPPRPQAVPSAPHTPGSSTAWDSGQRQKAAAQPGFSGQGRIKYDKFLGDMYVDCAGVDMQNVEVAVFIGDIEIKLHGAALTPGLNRLVISGFIGDVRILVPPDMAVFVQSSNFIGDADLMGRRSSGIGATLDAQTTSYQTSESKLYVASNFFIGDIRVYVV